MYEEMLRAVPDKADQLGASVDPATVICDFEQLVIALLQQYSAEIILRIFLDSTINLGDELWQALECKL